MNQLKCMALFVEVVKAESFSDAAEIIGLSRAQVSKSVMQLENHLGTRLLNRTTRRISLTETGQVYYEGCQVILSDIEEIECIAGDQTNEPRGTLRLSAPTSFSILHLNEAMSGFLKLYPQVRISMNLADRFIDVVSEGFDVVIRIAELEDSSLVARRIAPCKRIFCASSEYLERHGTPKTAKDLATHQCLIYANDAKLGSWVLDGPDGVESVKVKGRIAADNGDVLKSAAISGLGIALLPTFIIGPDLRAGRLQQVLVDYCPPDISIYAVFPSHRFLSAKVRAFVDYLSEYFGDSPCWDQ